MLWLVGCAVVLMGALLAAQPLLNAHVAQAVGHHSRYRRRLHDLPWQGRPVTLEVQLRRFRCVGRSCPLYTFAGEF